MLAAILVVASLAQDTDTTPFLWRIQRVDGGRSLVVTVEPTPFGLTQKLDVKAISLEPLPTVRDPKPRAIRPIEVQATERWGLRASFAEPGRRFHLRVTLSDGSIHRIDIYRAPPRPDKPAQKPTPLQLIAPPTARWT